MTRNEKIASGVAAGALSAYAALHAGRRRSTFSFAGRTVVITGGSRGLGLVLARRFAAEGARLALIARHWDDLVRAQAELLDQTEVGIYQCDVRDRQQVEATVRTIAVEFGRIDVLVNNAGIIQGGPLEHLTIDDFEQAMGVHFWGPLFMTRAALPYLTRPARIVNIASIGGKVAVPHLAAYCASKFAEVGLSDAIRNEVARYGIAVTTVCPGLMRVGSHLAALFKGRHEREFLAFALSAATPLTSINAERAARQIVEACRRGDPELTITVQARTAARLYALAPALVARALSLTARLLPGPNLTNGSAAVPGWKTRSAWTHPYATTLLDRAAERNNELASLH